MKFPSYTPLDAGKHGPLLFRTEVATGICRFAEAGRSVLIMGARHSGRTTMLRLVQRELERDDRVIPVWIDVSDYEATSDAKFFTQVVRDVGQQLPPPAFRESAALPADALTVFHDGLSRLSDRTPKGICLLFDGIDDLAPHLLNEFAWKASACTNEQLTGSFQSLKKVSFVFAGSVSLRQCTMRADPDVAPYRQLTAIPLVDPSGNEVRKRLKSLPKAYRLPDAVIDRIVHYCGGDLNLVYRFAEEHKQRSTRTRNWEKEFDAELERLAKARPLTEPALIDYCHAVEEDHESLMIALDLTKRKAAKFQPGGPGTHYRDTFGVTHPEMTGALVRNTNNNWSPRNHLTRLALESYFTSERVMRIHAIAGRHPHAMAEARVLFDTVRQHHRDGNLVHHKNLLYDIVNTLALGIYALGDPEKAYACLSDLLNTVFAAELVAYFEADPSGRWLQLSEYSAPPAGGPTAPQAVEATESPECRALRTGRTISHETSDATARHRTVYMPLFDRHDRAVAVIQFDVHQHEDQPQRHINQDVVLDIIQSLARALHHVVTHAPVPPPPVVTPPPPPPPPPDPPQKRMPVFVAHQYDEAISFGLRRNLESVSFGLRRNLEAINGTPEMKAERLAYDFLYAADFGTGFIFETIRDLITKAELCLFDITHPDVNVMLELGMAIGSDKPTLFVRNNTKANEPARPRPELLKLLDGMHRREIVGYADVPKLRQDIRDAASSPLLRPAAARVEPRKPFILLIEHDEAARTNKRKETEFCGVVRGVAKDLGVEVLSTLAVASAYPEFVTSDHPNDELTLVRLINAIRSATAVVTRIESADGIDAGTVADCFVAQGIARALLNPKKIVHTHYSPERQPTRPPADYRAHALIEWTQQDQLRDGVRSTLTAIVNPPPGR